MKDELDQIESSQRQWHEVLLHQERIGLAVEASEYNKFTMLKPKVFIDGNQYCVLLGSNIQDGIAGFGDTVHKAIINWNASFFTEIKP